MNKNKEATELNRLRKEVRELKESNQKLLALEEKREKEKENESKRKKSLEESLWWKKITAYASIISAMGVLFHFGVAVINLVKSSRTSK